MATLRDEEEQKGSGLNQALGQQPQAQQAQPQEQQAPMEGAGQAQIGASQGAKAPQAPAQKQQKAGTGTFANLKSYLQAAQGGGRVAQAATQRVQNVASQAQKGIQQAQKAFGTKMEAGSLQGMGTAAEEARGIIGSARGVTYQAPQPAPVLTQEQIDAQNQARANYVPDQAPEKVGGPAIRPLPYYADRIGINPPRNPIIQERDNYLKTTLGDKYQDFKNELDALTKDKSLADYSNIVKDRNSIYEKYGIDTTKLPGYNSGKNLGEYARSMLQKQDSTQSGESAAPEQPQAPAQPQQYFTPEQQQRFAEIINAQYQGPESLQQAGLYEQAARKAQTAQQALQQAQTAGGREQLLRDIFGRSRDYSRGQSKLDALLLNTSQQGVQSLQEQAQKAGNVQQQLQEAQNLSANEAARRAEAIQGIASGARTAFTEARTAEEQATNKRITDLIETPAVDASGNKIPKTDSKGDPILDSAGNVVYQTEWDRLPEYFRNVLREAPKGQVKLSPEEMAILGVGAGEGLYNLGENLIGNVAAERERLITKDELSRQLALQQLAGLDVSKELQKDLLYKDLEKAGTQTLGSSLNVEGIREALKGAQEGFKTAAEQATLTGTGSKKVSRGNVFGKKTKTYTAEESGNVAEMLRQGGYDVSKMEPEQVKSLLTDKDLLDKYLGATSTSRDTESNIGGAALEGAAAGATTGASIGSLFGGVGAIPGAAIGTAIGGAIGANTLDPIQATTDLYKELEDKLGIKGLGAVGQGVQDVRSGVGGIFSGAGNIAGSNVVGDVFRGVGGAVSGINTGEMKSVGERVSKRLAQEDLANKYKEWLQGQGFENRLVASQDPEVLARSAALQNLLRRQG